MMKQIFRKITAALCAGALLCTSAALHVSAEEETFRLPSGLTLPQMQREFEDYCTEQLSFEDDRDFASAAVGVFQGDEMLFTGYYGDIDIFNNVPASEDSVYEWGSISKTLIWVSAMQLWEQGILDLERDVREYLPEGFFQHLSYDEPITMLNLMNHNAGWQETTRPIMKSDASTIGTLAQELQEIEPAQVNRPGEIVAYSNYGAAVAGLVIECVTGQDYCEYVHEHIFEPLGMDRTALNPTHSDNAWVFENRKKTRSYSFTLLGCNDLGPTLEYIPAYPAGAATGTLSDLMTYAQALVNDDAPLFRNKETQEIMLTATDCYGESDIPLCAHGFFYAEYAVRTFGHSGATSAGQANMLIDPETKTGLCIMVNEPSGNWYLGNAPFLVFGDLSPETYASGTPEPAHFSNNYLMARANHCGMLKFVPYLTAYKLGSMGDAQYLGNGVYQFVNGDAAQIIGEKTTSDGRTVLQQVSMDLLPDSFYLVKLCLLTLYVLVAVAGIFQMLIQRKLKKHGKNIACAGSAVMTAGQIARIISVIAWLWSFMIYANNSGGGIPYTQSAVIGIVQMLVIAVCSISAVTSCIFFFPNKNNKVLAARYILNTIGCILPVIAIVYFEMYRFWQM